MKKKFFAVVFICALICVIILKEGSRNMIITIDGPSGTGKTTVAKGVAEKIGGTYFDTGAMFRAVTYLVLKQDINVNDHRRIEQLLKDFVFSIREVDGVKHYFANGEDVSKQIRSQEVTLLVSPVSALSSVRSALAKIQRNFVGEGKFVFEGRDMGTVIFPNAEYKFFLTATPEVCAERRFNELVEKKLLNDMTKEAVLADIKRRDDYDSNRDIAPLKQADDAILIDTSNYTAEQVINQIVGQIL